MNVKLSTRNDVAKTMLDIIRPLKPFYSEGHAWLEIGNIGADHPDKTSKMEAFARILWGLGPLWTNMEGLSQEVREEAEEWRQFYITGIVNGTDPEHKEYWGTSFDFDQKIVEMAAIVSAIALAPHQLWEPLTQKQKDNLYNFLEQANYQDMAVNNWRYFRIFINMLFRKLGLPFNAERLKTDRAIIESCYVGDGWYFDGHEGQVDYYIPFAMHFYALIFAQTNKEIEPEYCAELKARAEKFSYDFIYWFGKDGNEIPFGRSLTYRFAHNSYFGAMAYAGVEGVGYGVMKNLALRNLEQWLARPIFDNAGILTIGYGYPNQYMSERYNAAGSPYWAFKSFIMLAVPDDHPFWTSEPVEFDYDEQKHLKHSYMIITHDDNNHVLAYVAGQNAKKVQGCCPQKYAKFVYSNQFGFNVTRDSVDLSSAAPDNTIVASIAGDDRFAARYIDDAFETSEQAIKMNYSIFKGVDVKSVVIPCGAWHVRVHNIKSAYDIDVAEGAFALKSEPSFSTTVGAASGRYSKTDDVYHTENSSFVILPWGASGIVSLTGGETSVVDCVPNTNLFYNVTALPVVSTTLEAGEHTMISLVYGDMSPLAQEKMKDMPQVEMIDGKIIVTAHGKKIEETFLA